MHRVAVGEQGEASGQPGAAGEAREASVPIVVRLPIPDGMLSPNGRGHWAAKARAVKLHRHWAYMAAFQAVEARDVERPVFAAGVPVLITATVYRAPRNKVQDDDNIKASAKAYLDGCTDAGVWADDAQARWGAVRWATAAESWDGKPGIELVLTEAA